MVYYETTYQPIHVRTNQREYPGTDELEAAVQAMNGNLETVHLSEMPDPRMQNVALLGRIASLGAIEGVTGEIFTQALSGVVPAKAMDANLNVFRDAAQ